MNRFMPGSLLSNELPVGGTLRRARFAAALRALSNADGRFSHPLDVSAVAITLLGGFGASVDGEPVADNAWRLRKARDLVKLLALAPGRRLHREQVMDALWRERGPNSAANNLYQAVHAARRAIGAEAIVVREELLSLVAETDVDEFERAAVDARRHGTPAAYRAALAAYSDELLPENRYEDWAIDRREALARLHAELSEELATLGPSDDLHSLPAYASSFVGRGHELAELSSLLAGTRLLTLAGTGGVGKTRLALELARGAEPSYEAGAVLVELAPVDDPGLVVSAVAAGLDVRALPNQPLVDAVVDFLAPRALLLVVDNCEHLLTASAALADTLLRAAPRLAVVATSREPLRIPGEVVFRVPSLAIPDPDRQLSTRELVRYEAVRLFVERATAAEPGFELDDENALDVVRICVRLDGLPLALELAAGRVGTLGPASVAARLDDRFRLLRTGSHAAPTRQQTLEATLQWSHDLLEWDERLLLRRLAVFAGSFDLSAVEAVCRGDGLDVRDCADVLARLVEKSLVAVDATGRERRYRLLETVRLYARHRLDEAGETTPLTERHARWALALAERERDSPVLDPDAANLRAAFDTLLAREPGEALRLAVALWPFWLRRIDLSEARRRLADALAAAPEPTALRAEGLLAAAAIDFRAGALAIGGALAAESLSVASGLGDAPAEWRAVHFLGGFAVALDDGKAAAAWFERALELARREGLAGPEALCVYSLGVSAWLVGDLARAEELVAQSVELFQGVPDGQELVPSPVNIAQTLVGEPSDGHVLRIVFEETLVPFVEVSCETAAAYTLANLAALARERGDLSRARELLESSAERFARVKDERGQADVLVRRGYLELAEGSLEAARSSLEAALELRRRMNNRRGVGLVLSGLGLIDTASGRVEDAERNLAEARDLFRRAGDRWGLASSLWRTADLALAQGDLDGAETALLEAYAVLAETRRERWIAQTVAGLGETALRRGDEEGAAALFDEARRRYEAGLDPSGVAFLDERRHALARIRKGHAKIPPVQSLP
jgi:predicted ATPase